MFLPRAKALLRSAAQATAQARAAAQPSRITVGYTTGLIVTPAVRELRREHPDADVQALHLDWDQRARCAARPPGGRGGDPAAVPDRPAARDDPLRRAAGAGWCPSTIASRAGNRSPSTTSPTNRCRGCGTPIRPGVPSGASIPGPTDAGHPTVRSSTRSRTSSNSSPPGRRWPSRPAFTAAALRPDITTVPLEGVEPSHVVSGDPRRRPQPPGGGLPQTRRSPPHQSRLLTPNGRLS